MKKLIMLLFFLAAIAIFFASCGNDDSVQSINGESGTIISQEPVTDMTTEAEISDDLPDTDFWGHEFRFFAYAAYDTMYAPDSETGEVVNDAVFRRNTMVEERFNVKIKAINSSAVNKGEQQTAITKAILAGSEDFDIVLNIGKYLTRGSVAGQFINLYDVEYLDFSKPWWSPQMVEDLTFNGRMFVASNNLHYEEFGASKIFYFNKNKIRDYNLEDPYKTVFVGAWTIDHMISMTRDIYEDLNGDGKSDINDFYGMLTTTSHNTWSVAFDIPEWEKSGNEIKVVALSEKMLSAFDKIHDYYFNSRGLYSGDSSLPPVDVLNEIKKMFAEEHGLFCFGYVSDSGVYYRNTDVDFGIVPFPKYDESQSEYRVFFGANNSNMFAVPIFASDTSRTGIIIEAMSAEGYKQLIPAYYQIALKDKYLRDESSIKMLDLVTKCRTISFSYCYDNHNAGVGFGNCFTSENKDNYTSFFASRENILNARIKDVINAFSD